ncbi:HNH endonuclease [Clostridium niameyense]|nr:HNH endonuclease [Clostridium niameyense]
MKLCRCGKLIPQGQRYCQECSKKLEEINRNRLATYDKSAANKKYDKNVRNKRDKTYARFYRSKEWKKLRECRFTMDHGLCQECLRNNRITAADIVHHKKEIKTKDGWNKRLDIYGLESLCYKCHNAIHKRKKYCKKSKNT